MNVFLILLALALIFDFLNGLHDSSNVVATVISSGALRPRTALLMAAGFEFLGPFLFGTAVAATVGGEILPVAEIGSTEILAALISAVVWNLVTWYIGLPSSSSHALIGGLLGASILVHGTSIVQLPGLIKVLVSLLISPPLGLIAGFLIMRITLWMARKASPKINAFFRSSQMFTLAALALSHGSNDAQKTIGIITLGLVACGYQSTFHIETWVIAASASAIALGTSMGGWRIIRTLGARIYRIRPVHGFTSQLAGASVILGAAFLGGPVSTTHVMSSAITGVGAAERLSKVRWGVMRDMLVAWLLTIPITAGLAALVMALLPPL
ncbi:MAG TPA: inorganic phosphate transporter [Anaerolineae bacterium]|nr:inorganic phosphate transporter [Anaerolineae bacterium]